MQQQLNELWQYAQSIAAAELDDDHDPSGFDKITSEKIEQTIATINEALKDKPIDKKIRQKLNYAKKNWPSALVRYTEQENIIGDNRSSYSKTDEDATFMRMKEDHMKNGQLKPAYNLQISTNNQYIVNYSLHQNTTDTNTLRQYLNIFRRQYGKMPTNITADAGYGSEQNYGWLEKKRITAYVKYNHFDRDQHGESRNKNPYRTDKLIYDQEKDKYICPSGKTMKNIGSYQHLTKAGFKQTITRYKAGKCNGCPLRSDCHGQKGNRIIEINHNLNRLKRRAEKRLKTKRGIEKRKQRCHDTEPVFANIKHNHLFKRFMMQGLDKVSFSTIIISKAQAVNYPTASV